MKLPRDVSASRLVKAMSRLGYQVDRQSGSHIRLTTLKNGEHHITIPDHAPLRAGTLNAILRQIAEHHRVERDDLIRML